MSKRASQIILLCEDILQDVFVRRFLRKGWEIRPPVLRVITTYPRDGSGGSGEKHVRDNYPKELSLCRQRNARAKTILIVVIDADTKTVKDHHAELDRAVEAAGMNVRSDDEYVVHIIPKRHIETWLAYLDGKEGDETKKYKRDYEFKGGQKKARHLIDKLVEQCKEQIKLNQPPPSLEEACREFERIRAIL